MSEDPTTKPTETEPRPPDLKAKKREEKVREIFEKRIQGPSDELSWRGRLYEIIFEAETRAGYIFDVALLWAILLSIIAVMLESVPVIRKDWGETLYIIEWVFTGLFTIEYILRLIIVRKPKSYATSFFGVVDLLAVLPAYLGLFVAGTQAFTIVRVLRVLRVFRLFKLSQFVDEAESLTVALAASLRKITVFFGAVVTLVIILGAVMYLVEPAEAGFDSIPRSIYWAIVTLTTVGYGDISPITPLGQFLAAFIMLTGYSIIAVPTGIVTGEIVRAERERERRISTKTCPTCLKIGHEEDAEYCKYCGGPMDH